MNIKFKLAVVILAVSVLVSTGVYFVYQKYYFLPPTENNSSSLTEKQPKTTKPESEKPSGYSAKGPPAAGWKLYKNAEFGFEIQYPTSWTVTEKIEENVRGEMVKEFFFRSPNSDLRFSVLPRDGLSYGVGATGTSTPVYISGFSGMQTQYVLKDSRRLWLIFPQYRLYNWLEDLGRIDAMTSAEDPIGDSRIFEQMLNSFKLER